MEVPLVGGIGLGIALHASKGVFDTPALFGRIAYTTLPICGIGFYYLAGTYITERVRGKDTTCNHVIGAYCTFPVLRKFMSLSATMAILFLISLPIYAVAYDLKEPRYRRPRLGFSDPGIQATSYDLNMWLKQKPSEIYVKRDSYDLFSLPSK
ncbi:uncharacterized protein LOC122572640 isoform X2 [Bombus pyrosoma]|nr:uncharacterized protein LOC122572640 isoform X2 [Bombus pyrosoma]XP_043593805.1 uncharacterized protein LOC122572640 isoform X2 [Bombus pyrosoma]XP_043593807.1 uncharacterized protein LOC122572640 isoform X2 [Bombus pyrosoma]